MLRLADRLLAALIPAIGAGACVPNAGDYAYPSCGCGQGRMEYQRTCRVSCTGPLVSCTACYRTNSPC
ncbi:hypothetical protein Afil01_57710 [Actinorhabdospora filicis]|uniref:Kazal-like domain-containing protein n=1 Tax=Actinorhabdospora filicis TaxID=1785913 RepID=A0A9W6SS47_9ACTN|nr:hypothetical protein [Actinorhabdospora filicis]GLZ80964.1 hypothetical protein Afil01_57710 [Actinorhabdospora filicis]